MKLFTIENYIPVPTDEVYATEAYAKLMTLAYNKQPGDKDGRKRIRGTQELRFIYFCYDYGSEYAEYSEKERKHAALEAAGLDPEYKISKQLQDAIEHYLNLQKQDRSMRLLSSARRMLDELDDYFSVLKLVRENEEGEMVPIENADTKTVRDNISSLAKLLEGLDKLEEQVKKNQGQESQFRGDATPGRLR